ncbi:YihY/virulence factor BrkB family protein [Curtobacterium sp. ISL-83]|uniref:YihY/virulence factor BrkB family protein n=1 Tax=Curtobacterium sp. ISL-83 TaxID=2819145 RepID=UPI001BE580A6|nr:YihY/virulence factor BrkB family protein [Curtobacterium sp. ISL-83]MBT2503461.1 YihY/virulence factor BrkB family protein [Curtobacterium sp. ISL-83]
MSTTTPARAGGNGPGDDGAVESPTDLKRPTWRYTLGKAWKEFIWDTCTDLAAVLTYHAVLSVFPALLALVALLGLVGQAKSTTSALLNIADTVAPGADATLKGPIETLVASPSAGIALIVGLAVAVWSASGYVRALSRAMNRIYEVEEGRPIWTYFPIMLITTVCLLVLVALMGLLLVVAGPIAETIGGAIGLGHQAVTVWNIARWPVLVVLAVVMLALLYYATPNVKLPKFSWISLGAVIALVLMALASLAFSFYVANFSHYNKTYGAIGGVIVGLLWLWIINLAVLFGAEFDSEAERGRELQSGIAAEEQLQLPVRDDRATVKRHEQERAAVQKGRALRLRFGKPDAQPSDTPTSDARSTRH